MLPETDEEAFLFACQEIDNKLHSRPVNALRLEPAIKKLETLAENGHKLVALWHQLEKAIQAVFPHHKTWSEDRTKALILREIKTLEKVANDDDVEINDLNHIKRFCESFAKAFQQILVQHRAAQRM